jgi:hypothetical protein
LHIADINQIRNLVTFLRSVGVSFRDVKVAILPEAFYAHPEHMATSHGDATAGVHVLI